MRPGVAPSCVLQESFEQSEWLVRHLAGRKRPLLFVPAHEELDNEGSLLSQLDFQRGKLVPGGDGLKQSLRLEGCDVQAFELDGNGKEKQLEIDKLSRVGNSDTAF